MSPRVHPALLAHVEVLRRLGLASLAHDLGGLGGVLCSEEAALQVIDWLVRLAEAGARDHAEVERLRREVAVMGEELGEARRELGRRRGA